MTPDLSTFAKVRALHDSTTHPAERASAKARMTTLAAKAGMTVEHAMSKLDAPEPKTAAQATADAFNEFFNSPEMRADRAKRDAERRAKAVALVEEYGSEEAVFADTPLEAALRAACEPLLGPGETWQTIHKLDGWGQLGGRDTMPASVRKAVSEAWPLPSTIAEAWAEYEASEKLIRDRYTVDTYCDPWVFQNARRYVVEELCNTLPARSLNELRARLAWMQFWADSEVEQSPDEHRTNLATLRADIERMGARLRGQDAGGVQSGQDGEQERHPMPNFKGGNETVPPSPSQGSAHSAHPLSAPDLATSSAVQFGQGTDPMKSGLPDCASLRHAVRRTNADKRRDVLALLDIGKSDNAPLTDREIARRAGVSPTTVGTIRRSLA